MESTIAAIIFAVAAAGIFATVAVMRKPAAESEDRVNAAYFAKEILEDLRSNVDARNWDTGDLSTTPTPTHTVPAQGKYTAQYTVTTMPSGAKKVDVTVTWPDDDS